MIIQINLPNRHPFEISANCIGFPLIECDSAKSFERFLSIVHLSAGPFPCIVRNFMLRHKSWIEKYSRHPKWVSKQTFDDWLGDRDQYDREQCEFYSLLTSWWLCPVEVYDRVGYRIHLISVLNLKEIYIRIQRIRKYNLRDAIHNLRNPFWRDHHRHWRSLELTIKREMSGTKR